MTLKGYIPKSLLPLYSEVGEWLNERWEGRGGHGIHGWDLTLQKDPHSNAPLLFLNVGLQQPSEEEAEDQCIEIDELICGIDSYLLPWGDYRITWDSSSTYETNEEEDEELEVYATFHSKCYVELYHTVAIIAAQKNYSTKNIDEQYRKLFEKD
jgi:hypothetical protein